MKLRIGKVYSDEELKAFGVILPEPSLMGMAVWMKLQEMKDAVWDRDAEMCVDALLEVIEWHKPWQHWEQVFRPTYVGTRYLGPGCRTCGPMPGDCMTVRGIAMKLGVWNR